MSTNTTSVGAISYNLPDLKCTEGDVLALDIFQIVEEAKAHLSVTKKEMVSKRKPFFALVVRRRVQEYYPIKPFILFIVIYATSAASTLTTTTTFVACCAGTTFCSIPIIRMADATFLCPKLDVSS